MISDRMKKFSSSTTKEKITEADPEVLEMKKKSVKTYKRG